MGPIKKIVNGVEEILEIPASILPPLDEVVEVTGDIAESLASIADDILGF